MRVALPPCHVSLNSSSLVINSYVRTPGKICVLPGFYVRTAPGPEALFLDPSELRLAFHPRVGCGAGQGRLDRDQDRMLVYRVWTAAQEDDQPFSCFQGVQYSYVSAYVISVGSAPSSQLCPADPSRVFRVQDIPDGAIDLSLVLLTQIVVIPSEGRGVRRGPGQLLSSWSASLRSSHRRS